MRTQVVMALGFASALATFAAHVADESSKEPLVTTTIQGESLGEVLGRLCTEYRYTCGYSPELGNRRGRYLYVAPKNAADAFQQIAAAYESCAVIDPEHTIDGGRLVHFLPCDVAERLHNRDPSELPKVALGVVVQDASVLIDGEIRGAAVFGIDNQGPGYKAGIREGDSILSYMGEPIADSAHLRSLVGSTRPGDGVLVEVLRGSEHLRFNVQF